MNSPRNIHSYHKYRDLVCGEFKDESNHGELLEIFFSYIDGPITMLEILNLCVETRDFEMIKIFSKVGKYRNQIEEIVLKNIRDKDDSIVKLIAEQESTKLEVFYKSCEGGNLSSVFYENFFQLQSHINLTKCFEIASKNDKSDIMLTILNSNIQDISDKSISNLIKNSNTYIINILLNRDLKCGNRETVTPYIKRDNLIKKLNDNDLQIYFSINYHSRNNQDIFGEKNNPLVKNKHKKLFIKYYHFVYWVFRKRCCKDAIIKILEFI